MIRKGYLSGRDRKDLLALARDGSCPSRLIRRANVLLLLDDGLSCKQVVEVHYFDDDTIRRWHELFIAGGVDALTPFDVGGSACQLSDERLLHCSLVPGSLGPSWARHARSALISCKNSVFVMKAAQD